MAEFDFNINRFFDNSVILDVALEIEKFLSDIACLYPYKGWQYGEIVFGPLVKKYFIVLKLKYEYNKMPDPEGGKILEEFNIKVSYQKIKEKVPVKIKSGNDLDNIGKAKFKLKDVWIITLRIPKDLVLGDEIEYTDDNVDNDIVKQAEDEGLDADNNYVDDAKNGTTQNDQEKIENA